MSEAKHTPGPWQKHGSHIYTADPERAILAQVFNPGKRPEDYPLTENANLMAAAPELLGALEYLLKQCEENERDNMNYMGVSEFAKERASKAIQKARGLQQ
jgi:hypothetical protein